MSIHLQQQNIQFTEKQGQYLAFIFFYTKMNQIPPAEQDFQRYFEVSSASVHQMLKNLKTKELISSVPRKPRTIKINIPIELIPSLI